MMGVYYSDESELERGTDWDATLIGAAIFFIVVAIGLTIGRVLHII
jgi:hypothetical protein